MRRLLGVYIGTVVKNRFPGQTCVFCLNPSFGVGEHVWPLWFLQEFHGEGPFTAARAGSPYMKRDETPHTSESLQGVHVPACAECNAILNRTLEDQAKPIIRRILEHADSGDSLPLTADECAALARWLLKVGLLSAHPTAEYDHPGLQRDLDMPRLATVKSEWLQWMRAETDPPAGFSVYITRRDLRGEDGMVEAPQRILLPRVIVDDVDLNFMSRSFGLTGLNATIVWHPGWPITHPQVDVERAVQLWPEPHSVDFGLLPIVAPKEFVFWDGAIGQQIYTTASFERAAEVSLSVDSDPFVAFFGDAGDNKN